MKYNKSTDKALSQIKNKGYAAASAPRPVYAVGLNSTSNNHTLASWTAEILNNGLTEFHE